MSAHFTATHVPFKPERRAAGAIPPKAEDRLLDGVVDAMYAHNSACAWRAGIIGFVLGGLAALVVANIVVRA